MAAPTGPTPAPDGEPTGAGYTSVVNAGDSASGCRSSTFEVAKYLQRGELTVAGRPPAGDVSKKPEFTASWLIKLRNGSSQIGFAGYDQRARRAAPDRGIGSAREHAPTLFSTGDAWTVTWFDDEGLAYAHPEKDPNPAPSISHLPAAKGIDPLQVGFAKTVDGSLVVASNIGAEAGQLSLFLFAPADGKDTVTALAFIKSAKKASFPTVAADEEGYTVAWLEEDKSIVTTRVDTKGKELDAGAVVVKAAADRAHVRLTRVKGGSLLTWLEGGKIFARKLDSKGKPSGNIVLVGAGKHPAVVNAGDAAIVAFVTKVGEVDDQLVAVRVSDAAAVSAQGVRVSDAKTAVLDPPAMATAGDRLAVAWTEVMGPTIQSKRAWLRVLDAACLK